MNLFNLFAKLVLDTSDYDKKLDDAGKKGSSFSSKLGTAMKAGAKAVMAVGSAVATTAVAIAGLTLKIIDQAGEIDDNAQRLGMNTEQYQLWSFAMQKAGTDVSTLQVAMRELTTFTNELSAGQGEALLTLQKLGIGYEEFMAMDNATQLETIVGALQGMEDQTEKTRLAQELFGNRAYQTLMPLLNEEQGSIQKLNETMKEQGLIVEEDLIKKGAELGDQIDVMKGKFSAYSMSLVAEVFPALDMIVNGLLGIAQGSEGATEQFTKGIIQMVDKAVTILPGLLDVASNLLIDVIMALIDSLPTIVPQLVTLIENILFKIVDLLPDLLLTAVDIISVLLNSLLRMDWLGLLTEIIDLIIVKLPEILVDLVVNIFGILMNLLLDPTFYGKIGQFGINLGISLVNGIIDGLNRLGNIKIPGLKIMGKTVWDDTTISLFNLPKFPLVKVFADGGMFDELLKGTAYAVAGEDGAEVVAKGRYGTGVANVEQIAEAQLLAMEKYDMRSEIRRAVEGIVNGLKSGNSDSSNIQSMFSNIVLKIGDKEFKAYVYQVINEVLENKGLKNLQAVGRY